MDPWHSGLCNKDRIYWDSHGIRSDNPMAKAPGHWGGPGFWFGTHKSWRAVAGAGVIRPGAEPLEPSSGLSSGWRQISSYPGGDRRSALGISSLCLAGKRRSGLFGGHRNLGRFGTGYGLTAADDRYLGPGTALERKIPCKRKTKRLQYTQSKL